MADDPGRGHFVARLQGALYGLLHATTRRIFLGATIKGWLINLPLLLALFLVLLRRPISLAIGIFVAALVLRLLYWKAARDGYVHFVAETEQQPADGATAVTNNQKVAIRATGVFSVKDWEEYVLGRPAEYWQVSMGDHAIMVQRSPGRFLYQFLRPGAIESVEAGLLWHGARPHRALAVTYRTSWGPESEDPNFMFYAPSDEDNPARKQRSLFLAFESKVTRDSVWQNLLAGSKRS